MESRLGILVVEDLPSDVELIERELRKLERPYELQTVMTDQDFREALVSSPPDLVLSDYLLPQFNGMEALKILQELNPDIPFIIVTGSMNEMTAVDCMKAGAWDYVIKEKLSRLAPAVESALQRRRLIAEKKSALASLKESEERFRTLIESAPLAIVVYMKERITYANQVAVRLSGAKSADDLIGRHIMDFVHPDYREFVQNRYARSLAGDIVGTAEEKFVTLDGREVDVEITSMPITLSGERGFMSILNDITQRKQATARYQQLVEQSNDAIYLLFKGKFELINRRFTELFGYTREECNQLDFNFMNLIAPESQSLVQERMEAVERGKPVPKLYEFTALSKDGKRIICEASVSYVRYKDGFATQGIIRDITARKQAEENIRKLSQAVKQSTVGILITDRNGMIEYINPALLKMLGYREDELIGKETSIFQASDETRQAFLEMWTEISQGKTWQKELEMIAKDGRTLWVKIIANPLFGANREITHYMSLVEDISQRKLLEAQFQQAQKMEAIGQLAGGVAHDFNNLLTVINGYSDLILSEIDRESPIFDQILEIKRAGERASSLTRQLLAFSRKQIMRPEILDVNQLIKNMEKMLRRLIGEDIDFVTVYDDELKPIKADPGQIEQVILNLVVNARDAMPGGGRLIIETRAVFLSKDIIHPLPEKATGWFAMIAVSDTGIGMDRETKERIFEPFFTTKEKGKGTGLGLATVYGIVKQSSGIIDVYSEPGKGTTFKLYFPLVDQEELDKDKKSRLRKNLNGNETILVVEDDPGIRELLRNGLSRYGYRVFVAGNRKDALSAVRKTNCQIDLLVTDVVMPELSGPDLTQELKKQCPNLSVLYMSGYTDESIVHHGILSGDTNFIQKPFGVPALAEKIREVLDNLPQKAR